MTAHLRLVTNYKKDQPESPTEWIPGVTGAER